MTGGLGCGGVNFRPKRPLQLSLSVIAPPTQGGWWQGHELAYSLSLSVIAPPTQGRWWQGHELAYHLAFQSSLHRHRVGGGRGIAGVLS
jgi:hypothetical protein